jgi:hypothetical protein
LIKKLQGKLKITEKKAKKESNFDRFSSEFEQMSKNLNSKFESSSKNMNASMTNLQIEMKQLEKLLMNISHQSKNLQIDPSNEETSKSLKIEINKATKIVNKMEKEEANEKVKATTKRLKKRLKKCMLIVSQLSTVGDVQMQQVNDELSDEINNAVLLNQEIQDSIDDEADDEAYDAVDDEALDDDSKDEELINALQKAIEEVRGKSQAVISKKVEEQKKKNEEGQVRIY